MNLASMGLLYSLLLAYRSELKLLEDKNYRRKNDEFKKQILLQIDTIEKLIDIRMEEQQWIK